MSTSRPRTLICLAAALTSAGLAVGLAQPGQTPPSAPASAVAESAISGVVTDAATGQPIADALVQLGSIRLRDYPEPLLRQFTDARGRFVFTDLPAGSDYSVTVAKPGYFDGVFGATGPAASARPSIRVGDGDWFSTANVKLWKPGSISGTVVDERGEPVVGVYVRLVTRIRLAGADRMAVGQVTLTDDRGMYRIGQLMPGRYVAMVPSVQTTAPSTMALGVLLGATAQALPNYRRPDGTYTDPPMVDVDSTARVVVGAYPVPPPSAEGRRLGYPIAFSGGTNFASAAVVSLDAGVDRTGVDIRLAPVPVSSVSGLVEGPPEALTRLTLRLLPEGFEELGAGSEAATALVASDGSFTFVNVPAGNYVIDAPPILGEYLIGSMGIFYTPQLPNWPGGGGGSRIGSTVPGVDGIGFMNARLDRRFWARVPITVGSQPVGGVTVTLRPTMSLRGRLISEAAPNRPTPASPARFVSLESATGDPRAGIPGNGSSREVPPGEFVFSDVVPGAYVIRSNSDPWLIKSVVIDGRDVTDVPVDVSTIRDPTGVVISFTNDAASLAGTVTTSSGTPASSAAVIVFPVERERWTNYGLNPQRIKSARTATNGAFRFRSLHAGDYYVVAVAAERANDWRDPAFFPRAQAFATRLTIAWGAQATAQIRLTEVR